jgi:AraC-like DNA-binding protein
MLILDAAFRGGAVALLILLAALAWREHRAGATRLAAGLFNLSIAAYVVCLAPGLVAAPPVWLAPLSLVKLGTPALFWLWAATHFEDEFELSWHHAAAWAVLVLLGGLCEFGGARLACLAYRGLALTYAGLGLWSAISGRAGDLVEARRRLRVTFMGVAAGYGAGVVFAETALNGSIDKPPLASINALVIAAIAFVLIVIRQTASAATGSEPLAADRGRPAAVLEATSSAVTEPREDEARLLAELDRIMDEDRAYRAEGFGIPALARRMQIPEYRLRRLINRRLGHRNFTHFVNRYRLAEVKAALADPKQAEVPVLTIALDAGFQSIGPFNRAFKHATGMTPSEYRRHHAAAPASASAARPIV